MEYLLISAVAYGIGFLAFMVAVILDSNFSKTRRNLFLLFLVSILWPVALIMYLMREKESE